ncbi:ECF-type sigma factor [Aquisphaera insulae]|uniref:ECF-type sigma factor n=1 Tax=Aquisphaera insulae TaxID=2712864 RepID=UPI0013ED92E7|nr:ECF-type sigma factor [Aquisphaera insulae]
MYSGRRLACTPGRSPIPKRRLDRDQPASGGRHRSSLRSPVRRPTPADADAEHRRTPHDINVRDAIPFLERPPIGHEDGEIDRGTEGLEGRRPKTASELLPLVYVELRRLASHRLALVPPGGSLQATALVHEAYLRLVGDDPARPWDGRGHFFAAAAEAMRRILVDGARRKRRLKRGGGRLRVELSDPPAPDPDERILALDDALNRLALEDPVAAKVVELRQFAGLGHDDVAAALGITTYLARKKWTYARAWLSLDLGG